MPPLSTARRHYQQALALYFGAIFAATVALVWAGLWAAGLPGPWPVIVGCASVVLGVGALARGIYVRVRYPYKKAHLPYLDSWRFWLKFYAVILAESGIIYVLVQVLDAYGVQNGLFPLIVFVVGAHFYPLARWFGNTLWYGTATALCIGSLAVVAVLPAAFDAAEPYRSAWSVASAGLMVCVMLLTSLVSSYRYVQLVRGR